ncbi:hypothetical protein KP79_PYT03954 [Mizuhopecten yessoensis]|uniref:RING-type domain-containing protein n=1 Tax=Mizuhopecten yessoensis TaxID=6573 RepID=A0A210PSV7_MIZYE|nr:hypothetical protein KP79_PYT03954 [Mizuhopecten yessoensis]
MDGTKDGGSDDNLVNGSKLYDMDKEQRPRRVEQPGDDRFIRMPCGHNIERSRLIFKCRNLMRAGEVRFKCQHISTSDCPGTVCGQPLEYLSLRQIAVLTDEEKRDFEIGISQNYINSSNDIQMCPKCSNFCSRQNLTNRRVICVICSTTTTLFEFCCSCRGVWRGKSKTQCGNETCTSMTPIVSGVVSSMDAIIPEVYDSTSCTELPVSSVHKAVCDYLVTGIANEQMFDGEDDNSGLMSYNLTSDVTTKEDSFVNSENASVIRDQEKDVPITGTLTAHACPSCIKRQIACGCGETSCFIAELLNAKWGYMDS